MGSSFDLNAVVLSSDRQVRDAVINCLKQAGVEPLVFEDADAATDCIFRKKVDALIVELQVDSAVSILKDLRNTPSNWRAPSFAITSNGFREALGLAHFVFETPVDAIQFRQALRKAHEVMLRERYRYRRHAVQFPVKISNAPDRSYEGSTVNISEGGIALQCEASLRKGEKLRLDFVLKGCGSAISCAAEVVWSGEGLAGLRFISLNRSMQKTLEAWLQDRI
jgi:PilZ domain